jgi:hypothetical protein
MKIDVWYRIRVISTKINFAVSLVVLDFAGTDRSRCNIDVEPRSN